MPSVKSSSAKSSKSSPASKGGSSAGTSGNSSRFAPLAKMLKSVGSRGNTPVSSTHNLTSGSGVNQGSSVDDQQVAKWAVQMVVSGSKKGISTLCADVAQLMREKLKYEKENRVMKKELSTVKGEVELLRTMLAAAQQQLQQSSSSSGYHTLVDDSNSVHTNNSPHHSAESVAAQSNCHCETFLSSSGGGLSSSSFKCDSCECHQHHGSCKHCCFCPHLQQQVCTCSNVQGGQGGTVSYCSCSCHRNRSSLDSPPNHNNHNRMMDATSMASVLIQTDPHVYFQDPVITLNESTQTESKFVHYADWVARSPIETYYSKGHPAADKGHSAHTSAMGSQTEKPPQDVSPKIPLFQIPSVKIQSDMSTQCDPSVNALHKVTQTKGHQLTLHEVFTQVEEGDTAFRLRDQFQQTAEPNTMGASSQTGNDLVPMTSSMAQTCERGFVNSVTSQTERSFLKGDTSDKWCQFPLLEAKVTDMRIDWEVPRHLVWEPPFARTPLVTIVPNVLTKLNRTIQSMPPKAICNAQITSPFQNFFSPRMPKSKSMPRIKTSTPTRQCSPVRFVDSAVVYQSPQQVFTGRKSLSKSRLQIVGSSTTGKRKSRSENETPTSTNDNQFTFASYEGPKLSSQPNKKQLGIGGKKNKSWDNNVNTLPSKKRFPPSMTSSRLDTSSSMMSRDEDDEEDDLYLDEEGDRMSAVSAVSDGNNILLEQSILTCPVPMIGCRCHACMFVFQYSPAGGAGSSDIGKHQSRTVFTIGEKIKLIDGRLGYIRYIGHVGGAADPYSVYAGIELCDRSGYCDGCVGNMRYFSTGPKKAIFVPYQDLVLMTRKKRKSALRRSTSHSK